MNSHSGEAGAGLPGQAGGGASGQDPDGALNSHNGATGPRARSRRAVNSEPGPHYKWIALSNTTLGVLMATINQSIVLIALPDIFRGIALNPLSPGNTSYLLWMFMGFLVVSAVLVMAAERAGVVILIVGGPSWRVPWSAGVLVR